MVVSTGNLLSFSISRYGYLLNELAQEKRCGSLSAAGQSLPAAVILSQSNEVVDNLTAEHIGWLGTEKVNSGARASSATSANQFSPSSAVGEMSAAKGVIATMSASRFCPILSRVISTSAALVRRYDNASVAESDAIGDFADNHICYETVLTTCSYSTKCVEGNSVMAYSEITLGSATTLTIVSRLAAAMLLQSSPTVRLLRAAGYANS